MANRQDEQSPGAFAVNEATNLLVPDFFDWADESESLEISIGKSNIPSTYQSPPTKGTRLFPTPEESEEFDGPTEEVNTFEYHPAPPVTDDLSAHAVFEKLLRILYQKHIGTNSSVVGKKHV